MDNEQTPLGQNTKGRNLKIAIIAILLILPLVFLIVKFSKTAPGSKEDASTAGTAKIDLGSLENAAKTNPTFENLINLSNGYVNSNMPGKSVEPLTKAIELNPKSAIAYNNLGVAYTMLQQYNKGIDACTKAVELDSSFQLAKNNLNWAMSEKKNVLSFLEKQSQVPEASRDAQFYVNYGLAYLKIGDYDKSIEAWNKIFNYDPKSLIALNNIGTAFMMKNQVEDAIAVFKKAVEINGEDQLSKNNLAWAMSENARQKNN